ncbi:MAG: nickel-dependent hydrogenase large subunit [Pseudomonadota bacterium]
MSAAAASGTARRYLLRLAPDGRGGLDAGVERGGPQSLLHVMRGRTIDEATRFAGVLFPLCPRAHQAAFLRAAEAALGVHLPPEQAAAREMVVLAEAVAAGVWREALSWPTLSGAPSSPGPVRAARAASEDILRAVYADDWARLGGAAVRLDPPALAQSVHALRGAVAALGEASVFLPANDADAFDVALDGTRPLGEAIWRAELTEAASGLEETPRALHLIGEVASAPVAAWYLAQHRHLLALTEDLATLSDILEPSAALDVLPRDHAGTGLGVAITARGRLRHAVSIENGRIADWRAAAPTDWNFAAGGPVARAARRLAPGPGLQTRARRLVGAFDPCAPCGVVVAANLRGEAAHA